MALHLATQRLLLAPATVAAATDMAMGHAQQEPECQGSCEDIGVCAGGVRHYVRKILLCQALGTFAKVAPPC